MWRILIIEDEKKWIKQIERWFGSKGYRILSASSGEIGIAEAKREKPDLIILDLALKGVQGEEVLSELRHDERTVNIPIIIFSIQGDDRVRRLRIAREGVIPIVTKEDRQGGAVVRAKKWDLKELEAIAQQLLLQKLMQEQTPDTLQIRCGDHELRLGKGCIDAWVDGVHRRLAPREAQVLDHLRHHRGEICNVHSILDSVFDGVGAPGNVNNVIYRIRKRVEPDPRNPIFVENVRGFGYRLAVSS